MSTTHSNGTSTRGTSSGNKRKRGPSTGLKAEAIKPGERRPIEVNDLNQLVGDYKGEFTTYLGALVRNPKDLPVNYSDWRYVPKRYKDVVWNKILRKYEVPQKGWKTGYKQMGDMWKGFKNTLKNQTLKKYGNFDAAIAHPDDRVPQEQWEEFISIWKSDKKQRICVKNKANRSKQKMSHIAGRKSFAQIYEDGRIKDPEGKKPSKLDVYIITHERGNKEAVDDASREKLVLIREKLSQLPPELRKDSNAVDEIMREVFGEEGHGRVRCLGLGVSPKQVGLTKANVLAKEKMKQHEKKIRKEVREEVCQQFNEQKRELEKKLAKQEQLRKEEMATLQAQINLLTQQLARRSSQSSITLGSN